MKHKFLIAVITPSYINFGNFLRNTIISDSIGFKQVDCVMDCRGIHNWIGYIELYDSQKLSELYDIRGNIEMRRIKFENIHR